MRRVHREERQCPRLAGPQVVRPVLVCQSDDGTLTGLAITCDACRVAASGEGLWPYTRRQIRPSRRPRRNSCNSFVMARNSIGWATATPQRTSFWAVTRVLPLACSPHPCSYFGRTRPRRTRSTPLSRSTYVHLRPTVLALAETERKRDCPSRAVATLLRLGEYPLHVGDAVWFDFVVAFIDPWRPGNRGRVARDSPSSVRLSERCSNGLVRLRRRRRPAAVALHLRVQPLTPR
jgi:hypothetical protein